MPRRNAKDPNLVDRLVALPSPRAWAFMALGAVVTFVLLAYTLFNPLLPLLIAILLAYACSPLVDRLERLGWTRNAAVLAMLGAMLLALVASVALLLPPLFEDAKDMAHRFPDYARNATDRLLAISQSLGLPLPDRAELLQMLHDRLLDARAAIFHGDIAVPGSWVEGAGGLLATTLSLLLVPVFFYFILRDLPTFRYQALQMVPPGHRPMAKAFYDKADSAFSGYIRGQLTVSLILAVVFSTGLTLLGIRYGLLIGIVAGFLNIVPYVGQMVGLLLALMMAIVDFQGWGRVLALPVFFGTVNFLEGTFVTPRIVGDKVGLTPLESLLALLIGGSLLGFLGLVVAIPLAGVAKALFKDAREIYFASKLYRGR